jgi:two-component system, NtrC family, response regulator AtoC
MVKPADRSEGYTTETELAERPTEPRAESGFTTVVVCSSSDVSTVRLERGSSVVIGRKFPSDFLVEGNGVSRQHARFTFDDHGVLVEDLGSRNGTRVRGRVIERMHLGPGDEVEIGDARVLVVEPGAQRVELRYCTYDELTEKLGAELASAPRRNVAVLFLSAHGDDAHVSRWLPALGRALGAHDQVAVYSSDSVLVMAPGLDMERAEALSHALLRGMDPSLRLTAGIAVGTSGGSEHELLARAVQAGRSRTPKHPVGSTDAQSADAGTTVCVTADVAMHEVVETARRAAAFALPLLVRGETGSGKEVVARLIHQSSPRRKKPLVVINCASIPETLVEPTLFGHEKGAFTDARARVKGAFERADGGSLFLDEVGELSSAAQADLLRVLDTGRFSRIGSTTELTVDVRVITATHRNLENMVAAGSFREDLFYRLNAVVIEIPPLRERPGDIDVLAETFLREFARTAKLERRLSEATRRCLREYRWPGNVRELKNVIERSAALSRSDVIEPEDLPKALQRPIDASTVETLPPRTSDTLEIPPPDQAALRDRMKDFEARLIKDALERANGNRAAAAKLLGIPLRTFNHKLKALKLG